MSVHDESHRLGAAVVLAFAVACGGSSDSDSRPSSSDGGSSPGGTGTTAGAGSPMTGQGGIGGSFGDAQSRGGAQGGGGMSSYDWINPTCGDGQTVALPDTLCGRCILEHCSVENQQMLGPGWGSGSNEGPCRDFVECVRACNCGAQDCGEECWDTVVDTAQVDPSSPCAQALLAYSNCVETVCWDDCASSGG